MGESGALDDDSFKFCSTFCLTLLICRSLSNQLEAKGSLGLVFCLCRIVEAS